jgi:hypothetical protein
MEFNLLEDGMKLILCKQLLLLVQVLLLQLLIRIVLKVVFPAKTVCVLNVWMDSLLLLEVVWLVLQIVHIVKILALVKDVGQVNS